MQIEETKVASIRYIMKNSKNVILENTMNGSPVSYLHGSPGIQPALQAQLEGLKAGDKKVVQLKAEQGLSDEDFIFDIIIDDAREALKEEVVQGYPLKVNVSKCGPGCDC